MTDEQLSRVLGEHSIGRLARAGSALQRNRQHGLSCAFEAATNRRFLSAAPKYMQLIMVFDMVYDARMSPEDLLDEITYEL